MSSHASMIITNALIDIKLLIDKGMGDYQVRFAQLVLLIVLFFKNTMLFTGSQTDVVRRRYSSRCKGFQKNAWMGILPWS